MLTRGSCKISHVCTIYKDLNTSIAHHDEHHKSFCKSFQIIIYSTLNSHNHVNKKILIIKISKNYYNWIVKKKEHKYHQ